MRFKNKMPFLKLCLIASALTLAGCAVVTPWYGRYLYNPGSKLKSTETFDKTNGCLYSIGNNYAKRELLLIDNERVTVNHVSYSDSKCTLVENSQKFVYKYKLLSPVKRSKTYTDSTGNVFISPKDEELDAWKFDMLRESYSITCYSDTCLSTPLTSLVQRGNSGPMTAPGCENITLTLNQETDITACGLDMGVLQKDVFYHLMYYNIGTKRFYLGSQYAKPTDNQPNNTFYGTSDYNRPRYIDLNYWYDKVSDIPN